jgi:hypothetical protein
MTDELVPDDVRDFIQRYVDSVAQLEALLLLRASPNEAWDAGRTAKRLYTTEQEILEVLARLCADGFLTCKETACIVTSARSSNSSGSIAWRASIPGISFR